MLSLMATVLPCTSFVDSAELIEPWWPAHFADVSAYS